MDQIRFTSLHHYKAASHGESFVAGMKADTSPTDPTVNSGIDEFVFDPSRGTFASLQDPPSFSALMKAGQDQRACSFVV
jgi:hypothetical protein